MRDAAVAAINFSLSLMKGLIRQQISRLPFKCQASIQRAASGIKAARVEQNGTIYNQSQKSHSSAQPGVASSGSLYCCGTRETLSQPLFDDFLSVAFARVCFHRQVSPQRHLPSPPPPPPPCLFLPLDPELRCAALQKHTTASCQNPSEWTTGSALLSSDSWKPESEYLSPFGIRCGWAASGEWQPVEDWAELRLNLWSHRSGVLISFFFPLRRTGDRFRDGQIEEIHDKCQSSCLFWFGHPSGVGSASCHTHVNSSRL